MKNIGLTLVLVFNLTAATFAQYQPDPQSANTKPMGNLYGAIGNFNEDIGFGTLVFGSLEFPVFDPNLTLGPELGMGWGFSNQTSNQFKLSAGVRAAYYADWLIPRMPKQYDVFVSSVLGGCYDISSFKSESRFWGFMTIGTGGRYHFQKNMSLFGELEFTGYGSRLHFGLSIKLE